MPQFVWSVGWLDDWLTGWLGWLNDHKCAKRESKMKNRVWVCRKRRASYIIRRYHISVWICWCNQNVYQKSAAKSQPMLQMKWFTRKTANTPKFCGRRASHTPYIRARSTISFDVVLFFVICSLPNDLRHAPSDAMRPVSLIHNFTIITVGVLKLLAKIKCFHNFVITGWAQWWWDAIMNDAFKRRQKRNKYFQPKWYF